MFNLWGLNNTHTRTKMHVPCMNVSVQVDDIVAVVAPHSLALKLSQYFSSIFHVRMCVAAQSALELENMSLITIKHQQLHQTEFRKCSEWEREEKREWKSQEAAK